MTQLEVALVQLSIRALIGPRISPSEGEQSCPPKGTGECRHGFSAREKEEEEITIMPEKPVSARQTLTHFYARYYRVLVPMLCNVSHAAQNVSAAEARFVETHRTT